MFGLRDAAAGHSLTAALIVLAFVLSGTARAGGFTVLYAFGAKPDGMLPEAGLTADASGNLYGTTSGGGANSGCSVEFGGGCGTVFKLGPAGSESVLYSFCAQANCSDGENPVAGVVRDTAGNLYGTTSVGGSSCGASTTGCGVVFKLAPDGTETVLHSFTGGAGDGAYPLGGLVRDKAGNLYGTTAEGGAGCTGSNNGNGCGTVFKIAPDGTETVLYAFGNSEGFPYAGVIRDRAGNLYGTTYGGGNSCQYGCGIVFEVAPNGTETVLYAFKGGNNDGGRPEAPLITDKTGNLYGTTIGGGAGGAGRGIVFKIAPNGTETVLYTFLGGSDGATPVAGLAMDKLGNLYGTTAAGGGTGCFGGGCGTVFQIAPGGTEKLLHVFTGGSDGASPSAVLLRGTHATLYGTASSGGNTCSGGAGCGTAFKLRK